MDDKLRGCLLHLHLQHHQDALPQCWCSINGVSARAARTMVLQLQPAASYQAISCTGDGMTAVARQGLQGGCSTCSLEVRAQCSHRDVAQPGGGGHNDGAQAERLQLVRRMVEGRRRNQRPDGGAAPGPQRPLLGVPQQLRRQL